MKLLKFSLGLCLMGMLFFVSCTDTSDSMTAPELPPQSTMEMDFDNFKIAAKSESANKSTADIGNWLYATTNVGIWNTIIYTTLAVPVAAYKHVTETEPTYIGENTYEWTYPIEEFNGDYSAKLTAQIMNTEVHWKMYITYNGSNAFSDFLWFTGMSNVEGTQGYWELNHNAANPVQILRIDYKLENEEITSMKYAYVRELDHNGNPDNFNGSYIDYKVQEGDLDASYHIHAYDHIDQTFNDTYIEWSRANHHGRVKAPHFFKDDAWHCWNAEKISIPCEDAS